jgi:hypothetical protein
LAVCIICSMKCLNRIFALLKIMYFT